jgi:Holliday junction resolvase RusA-like endonuclease
MIRVFVPGQPVAKGRPRVTTRGGRPATYTPAKTVAYEGLVAHAAAQVMDGAPPLEGPLRLAVTARFQLPKAASKARRALAATGQDWHTARPDGDNVLKAVGDGLNAVLWRDDSQIAEASIRKIYSETPGLEIEVSAL